jgi:hypothetical protein
MILGVYATLGVFLLIDVVASEGAKMCSYGRSRTDWPFVF